MFASRKQQQQRQPHPDPAVEAEIQRILALRKVIARQDEIAAEYAAEVRSARREQDRAGRSYRSPFSRVYEPEYIAMMQAQQQRIAAVQAGLADAVQAVTAAGEEITRIISGLTDLDRTFLLGLIPAGRARPRLTAVKGGSLRQQGAAAACRGKVEDGQDTQPASRSAPAAVGAAAAGGLEEADLQELQRPMPGRRGDGAAREDNRDPPRTRPGRERPAGAA